ncbi:MAG: hypothetical protein J6K16_05480 [Alphaproteobacteria bacterium]|nr:hypothetical protein [Alphaproteobacteria bacterium]
MSNFIKKLFIKKTATSVRYRFLGITIIKIQNKADKKIYKIFGVKFTKRNKHKNKTPKMRLLNDKNIKFDYDFFCKYIERTKINKYKIIKIRLKDIKRLWHDGKLYKLEDCSPYKYLNGNINRYEKYCQENYEKTGILMSKERYDKLISSVNRHYDEKMMPIISQDNIILDGQHRCCILLKKYGPLHKIKVCKIYKE